MTVCEPLRGLAPIPSQAGSRSPLLRQRYTAEVKARGYGTEGHAHRVLHVLAPAREGGLERVVAMLAAGQSRRGVHVAAVLEPGDARGHPFVGRLISLGVPVTKIVVTGRSYLREYRLLASLVEKVKPSIVHTHGYRADIVAGGGGRALAPPPPRAGDPGA